MPVFVVIIVFSVIFYLYYKVKSFQAKAPIEKKWWNAKSSIALGLFVAVFGFNRLFITQTTVSIVIGILFIIVGTISIWTNFKAYKYYLSYVESKKENMEKGM